MWETGPSYSLSSPAVEGSHVARTTVRGRLLPVGRLPSGARAIPPLIRDVATTVPWYAAPNP
jgi:hypothetical protein